MDILWQGVAVVVAFVVLLVMVIALSPLPPSVCPKCGGDLVEWTDVFEPRLAGRAYRYSWRGCPKVRDKGAGSPATDDWRNHYATVFEKRIA